MQKRVRNDYMYLKSLSVTELNQYVKKILENDFILRNVLVEGEISNLKLHSSGHAYFSLKDKGGKINCVMFKSDVAFLSFKPEDGMKVNIKGRVSLYDKEGKYQFYVTEMTKKGEGELFVKYLALKKKLEEEGLFDEVYKKEIPKFNRNIGVVTSPTGAAVQDIISVAKRRFEGVNIYISPCLVQGINAPKSIINGIKELEKLKEIDLIIVTRGGGSLEELWAFNDEELARCIFKCKKPIVSAVGHETDYTIVDFVSDVRVPTPSAAAEIAVFDSTKYIALLDEMTIRLQNSMYKHIDAKKYSLNLMKEKLLRNSPEMIVRNKLKDIINTREFLSNKMESTLVVLKEQLAKECALLNSYNPLNVLQKGYSIIQKEDGTTVKGSNMITEDEVYKFTFAEDKVYGRINLLEE
ncbi:exodeoxyribonuclease VII large subunit [Oceanirhabdus sp. W0125-5]|uniref:exodeoxyribonuclease VII large subunit n=1 Tax=Oceanirhabdus sp. W0125-5 TaxID=2999116 RepID=UPI0022F33BDD|nr:exodeoxyribonuclease VII large subunit [Oceanirhabdus sp. W0125-5]WBW95324.1 exodeoxyribonuclease VII large subunit [Oceanirhabdus sp. W0125-5]